MGLDNLGFDLPPRKSFKSFQKSASPVKMIGTYSMTFRGEKGSKLTIEEMDNNFHYLVENGGGGGSVTGTPSQVLYFDVDGNVTGDSFFTRGSDLETSAGAIVWGPSYPEFTGEGLNDLILQFISSQYTGLTSSTYTITITGGLAPLGIMNPMAPSPADTFDWSCSTGATGSLSIDTSTIQELSDGFAIKFDNKNGHTIGDSWVISFQPSFTSLLVGSSALSGIINDNGNGVLSVNANGVFPSPQVRLGMVNVETPNNNQSFFLVTSNDGLKFTAQVVSSVGETQSSITVDSDQIAFNFTDSSYLFPPVNGSGPLINDGAGTLSWASGLTGTYSFGDGFGGVKVMTIENGIITDIS